MKYPKGFTLRLFGYELDVQLDSLRDRDRRIEELCGTIDNWRKDLKELEPLKEEEIADLEQPKKEELDEYEPLDWDADPYIDETPVVAVNKSTKKSTKKTGKKAVKKNSKKK